MKSNLGKRLKTALTEATEVAKGATAPSRVWSITRKADGTIVRKQLDPAAIQKDNKDRYVARQARTAIGLSQGDFAKMLGISTATLRNWEQGRRKPTGAARVLLRIAAKDPAAVLAAVEA